MSDKKIIYIGVPALVAVLIAVFYYVGGRAPARSPTQQAQRTALEGVSGTNQSAAANVYSNSDFKVVLQYPSSWKPVADKGGFNGKPLYFEGNEGFFGIDAVGTNVAGTVSIDDIVKDIVSDNSNPYGTSPSITSPNTGNIKSRLIVPSSDQPKDKNSETAFVVQYPKPVKIGTDTFLYLMLYGDRAHLGEIASTLQLVGF